MARHILVLDDDALIGQLLVYQLSDAGYCVHAYQHSTAALLHIAQEPPDLVLLDLMMPGTSGWDVCQQIRAMSNVPIIMLTAKQSDDDVVRGLNSGADDYMGKPFTAQQVLARINAVLRRSQPAPPRTGATHQRKQQPAPSTPIATHPAPPAPPMAMPAPSAPSTLGTRLRAARKQRNLSLHEAERLCNVRWEFLQAIEHEQFGYVPKALRRQALHDYSALLGIDLQPYLHRPHQRPRRYLNGYLATSILSILLILLGIIALLG
jgi:DNA-binding response OmpR family regulator